VTEDTRSGEPALPVSGADIRTFLFADMRGYTRFTQEHGDDAASALASRFADLVKETVPAFEGELLELRGDEALCVFRSARQALRASVELQRRLRTVSDEQPAFPIGVGMGLDAGEAVPTHGGYRGASLNLAARLCGLAKPGEILASETVIGLAGRVDGMRFLEGRSATLKGMPRPVRYVVVEPEQPLPPVPTPLTAPGRKWRPLAAAAVVVAVIVVAAVAVGLARSGGNHAVELKSSTLAELDPPRLNISRQVASRETPTATVFGGGALWAADASAGQVERVDPTGGQPVSIPVGSAPSALAYGFDELWVANAGDGTVTRISPAAGNIVQGSPIRVGNDPTALVATKNGVWVANGLDDTVRLINPLGRVTQTVQLTSAPSDLAAFGSSIWVAEPSAGTVVRIDAASGQPTGSVPVPGGPVALAAGAGRVWIASADGTLTGVDPTTAVPQLAWTVRVGRNPSGLAVMGGSAWVGSSVTHSLTQVATTGHVEEIVAVGAPTGALTRGPAGLWVSALPSVAAHRGGTLVGAVTSLGAESPDPIQVGEALDASIIQLTNDGLVALRKVAGSGGYELVPDLAAALPQPSPDGRTYTFQLRHGVLYSTGAAVKASDVRATIERAFTSNTSAINVLGAIAGAQQCAPQGSPTHPRPPLHCDLSKGIVPNDSSGTVTFHLSAPDPNFLAKLSIIDLAILPTGTPRDITGRVRVPATGPYEISRDDVNSNTGTGEIVLSRNRYFHEWSVAAQPDGYPDRIIFRARYTGPTAATHNWMDVEAGKADWTPDAIPPGQIPIVISRYPTRLHLISSNSIVYAIMDETSPPFSNVLARRALNYAIDRQHLLDEEGGRYAGIVTCQLLPPSFPGYQPYCPYTVSAGPGAGWTGPDIAKARALVRNSGTAGDRVVVGGSSDPVQAGLVKALDEIGYRVTTRVFPQTENGANHYAAWLGKPSRPPHVANSLGWSATYPGAYDFLSLAACTNRPGLNAIATFYCNPAFDRQLDKTLQVQQRNPTAANALWAKADRYVTNQAVIVPLWSAVSTVLVSKRVGNVQYTPAGTSLPLIDQMWVQ
jgi:ABC-type transport system substrate-binding protein/class 3 adenylate cyclase